jgi:hypothetical protein
VQERLRMEVPSAGEPLNPPLSAVVVDDVVFDPSELEPLLLLPLGCPPRALARARKVLRTVYRVDGPLLELDRVTPGGPRDVDQPLRRLDVAVVIGRMPTSAIINSFEVLGIKHHLPFLGQSAHLRPEVDACPCDEGLNAENFSLSRGFLYDHRPLSR